MEESEKFATSLQRRDSVGSTSSTTSMFAIDDSPKSTFTELLSSSGAPQPPPPPPPPPPGTPETTKDLIVHQLNGNETLQGLSLQYHVPIQAIMTANKLWPRDDIHVRKFLYIPQPSVISSPSLIPTTTTTTTESSLSEDELLEAAGELRKLCGCALTVARFYIETYFTGNNMTFVLQRYREDRLCAAANAAAILRPISPSREPLIPAEEGEDHVMEDPLSAPELRRTSPYAITPTPGGGGPAGFDPVLRAVSKERQRRRVLEKMPEVYNFIDMFYSADVIPSTITTNNYRHGEGPGGGGGHGYASMLSNRHVNSGAPLSYM